MMPEYNSNNRSNNRSGGNNNSRSNNGNYVRNINRNQLSTLGSEKLNSTNYVSIAEKVINHLTEGRPGNNTYLLTTSQIRNLLSLNSEIYNTVVNMGSLELDEAVISKLLYLKVRMVYESGRQEKVDLFIKNSHLIEHLEYVCKTKKKSDYLIFARYMEALVAYRKFLGGKDD